MQLVLALALEVARRAQKIGADGAEASWILEDNRSLTAPLEGMDLEPYKRWRIYEKLLEATGLPGGSS